MQYNAKQESEAQPQKWSWVESAVWSERMLAALDNGVKGNKWFSLWDKVYALRTLQRSWEQVKRNKGASGIDKVSIDRFSANEERYLQELSDSLKANRYQPAPVKRVHIPKGNGNTRPLGIPTVKDRIVQTALVKVIEPIFEKEFQDISYGFRPNRGCKDALRAVDQLIKAGYVWVMDADIQGYFDSIPHDRLINRVKERISDGKVLSLIQQFLKQPIMEELRDHIPALGTPQGAVISPLLANLYLHPLDTLMIDNGFYIIRYADDFVVLCNSQAQAELAHKRVSKWTEANGLTLHPEKTHIGNCMIKGQGFAFLGYWFESGNRRVRKTSMKKLRDKVRAKTKRSRPGSLKTICADLNRTLKGWFEYFKHAVKWIFVDVDKFVRRRLRSILRRRIKKKGGTGRCLHDHLMWPNKFFAEHGLFTMSEAHALACQSR